MGEAEDPTKAAVRGDIDQIRIKLDQSLELYNEGKIQEALTTSRSAYLDSYERVEIHCDLLTLTLHLIWK